MQSPTTRPRANRMPTKGDPQTDFFSALGLRKPAHLVAVFFAFPAAILPPIPDDGLADIVHIYMLDTADLRATVLHAVAWRHLRGTSAFAVFMLMTSSNAAG
jgi:hypothetical protein